MKEKRYKNGKTVITIPNTGRISFYIDADNCAYISRLNIQERHRGKGNGQRLLLSALITCKNCISVRLHVGISNNIAISLYEKHGFFKLCLIEDKTHWFMAKRM